MGRDEEDERRMKKDEKVSGYATMQQGVPTPQPTITLI